MSRYIDADKLKAHYGWHDKYTELTCKDFDDIVDAQPTVDTVCRKYNPRPIGEYCRWCGARMDGERKENDREKSKTV